MNWTPLCLSIFLGICPLSLGKEQNKPFAGYQLLSVAVSSQNDVKFLLDLENTMPNLDFWTYPTGHHNGSVLVAPTDLHRVRKVLTGQGIGVTVLHDDIHSLLLAGSRRTPHHVVRKRMAINGHVVDHHNYHTYNEIREYMTRLQTTVPHLVQVSNLPMDTYEGRPILLVKVGSNVSTESPRSEKPVVIIDAGIHAREWIAPATALYLVENFVQKYVSGDPFARTTLDTMDLYFIPVLNPDGYVFTHSDLGSRLWRKNRQPHEGRVTCVGVDLNRNFDVRFRNRSVTEMEHSCWLPTFPGRTAFSEYETMAFRSLFEEVRDRLKGYLTLHSKGQFLIRPWAYSAGFMDDPPNADLLNRVGNNMLKALTETHGTDYKFGTSYALLEYSATGTSMDWILAEKPGVLAYAYELRPHRDDMAAYALPVEQIIPTGEEVYASVQQFILGLDLGVSRPNSAVVSMFSEVAILPVMVLLFLIQ